MNTDKQTQQTPSTNDQGIPVGNLFKHFKSFHSKLDQISLPPHQISFKESLVTLEQKKDTHNVLDNPISINDIIDVKLLKPKKAPGPDKMLDNVFPSNPIYI